MTFLPTGALIAIGTLLAGCVMSACGETEPSAAESQVCGSVQEVVDHLAADRNAEAMNSLSTLQLAVEDIVNERMATAGNRFFSAMLGEVDYSQLTLSEVAALGDEYRASLAGSLDELIDECDDVGAPIQRLPGQ